MRFRVQDSGFRGSRVKGEGKRSAAHEEKRRRWEVGKMRSWEDGKVGKSRRGEGEEKGKGKC